MMRSFIPMTLAAAFASSFAATVTPSIPEDRNSFFISGDVWSNPMEDWQVQDGRIVNIKSGGDRNVVSLTSEIDGSQGGFEVRVTIDQLSEQLKSKGFVGFQIGLQGQHGKEGDYREGAIYGVGLAAGVMADGSLFIGALDETAQKIELPEGDFVLSLRGTKGDSAFTLDLSVIDGDGQRIGRASHYNVEPSWVDGLVALTASSREIQPIDISQPRPPTSYGGVAFGRVKGPEREELKPLNQGGGGEARFAFSDWKISGKGVSAHEDRKFGPIWWATYTLDEQKMLRLNVQLAPIGVEGTDHLAELEIAGKKYTAAIDGKSFTALFKVPLADVSENQDYIVSYNDAQLTGTVRALPTKDQPMVVASLSCNDSTGFPHNELLANVTAHDPDVITFHGDQIYEGIGGYGYITDQEANTRANICYLRKYAMHGWTWAPLLNTRPSITIPDDHDVMHGNIWGVGGKAADMSQDLFFAQDSGGYKMSPEFVNMVHRTQVDNLPLADDQPVGKRDITTYHSRWIYGPLDMIIIADRQFKSAPKDMLPEAEIHNGWPQNLEWNAKTDAHIEEAQLLGEIQDTFLAEWASQPDEATPFRLCISQSPWLAPQTLPEDMHHDKDVPKLEIYKAGGYAPNDEPKADFDTNGWPQHRQASAVAQLKKAGAIHIVGDQHLGTTGRYGVEGYGDGSWWIATPAIANVWPRRWMPKEAPVEAEDGWPRWKGGFEDGFGNKFTMISVANPEDVDREPSRLWDRAVGYAITRYNPADGRISLENWPYLHGPQHEGETGVPFPGWPVEVANESLRSN